jgi:hypothetical protein
MQINILELQGVAHLAEGMPQEAKVTCLTLPLPLCPLTRWKKKERKRNQINFVEKIPYWILLYLASFFFPSFCACGS